MTKISKSIQRGLQKYGLDYPTDARTKAYKELLNGKRWIDEQYIQFLKDKISEARKKEGRRGRYVGDIYLVFQYIRPRSYVGKEKKFSYTYDIDFDFYVKKAELQKELDKLVDEFKNKKLQDYKDVVDVHILKRKDTVHKVKKNATYQDIDNIRMTCIQAGIIDGYDSQLWDTRTGKCVFDYIIHTYKDIEGFKKICNYESLEDIFKGDDKNDEDLLNNGVNTIEVERFCRKFHIPMYALDDDEKCFRIFKPDKPNKKAPALIYRLSNNHIYPIKSNNKIKSIVKTTSLIKQTESDLIIKDIKKNIESNDDIKDIDNVVFCENVYDELARLINEGSIPDNFHLKGGQLFSFKNDKINYVSNEDIDMIKKLCDNMQTKYTGQGVGTCILNVWKEISGLDKIPKSSHNPHIVDMLLRAKSNRSHYGFVNMIQDNMSGCKAYDIVKCYRACMYKPTEDWIRLDFNDEWQPYDGTLKNGLYYVRTDDTMLFKKSNVYSTCIIKKAIKENINFKIEYQLIPSHYENKDLFVKFIDKVIEYSQGDEDIAKLLINMMSGLLGQTHREAVKCKINKDINQIFDWLHRYANVEKGVFIKQIPHTNRFLYGFKKDYIMNETNIPMYIQILDESNVRLYDMAKQVGGELVARKVDCVVVRKHSADKRKIIQEHNKHIIQVQKEIQKFEKDVSKLCNKKGSTKTIDQKNKNIRELQKDINYSQKHIQSIQKEIDDENSQKERKNYKWGDYRQCELPAINCVEVCEHIDMINNNGWKDYNIHNSDDYEQIYNVLIKNDGLLLQANAGNGKTYVAKKIAEMLGNKVKILAPTNKAALNIGGSTIHSFMRMTEDCKINLKLLKLIDENYDYIIIDEISMITKQIWKILCILKKETDIKFLLLGDDKQCPPVENEKIDNYFNSSVVKYLTNNNRNILTVRKRYDEDLYNTLKDVDKIDIMKFPHRDTQRNICYLNSTRKQVNKLWNDKLRHQDSLHIPADIDDTYTQDTYIYEGLPVIARKTKKDDDNFKFVNSETFTVSHYDDESICIWNERPDDKGNKMIYCTEVEIKEFNKYFAMNYCSTTHKSQGETIVENYTIYDWEYMNTKIQYTALSRAKNLNQVTFKTTKYTDNDDVNFDDTISKKINGHMQYDCERGFETNITVEDVKTLFERQNGECIKCECQMKTIYQQGDGEQFSIDRIDSSLGHIKGNIQLMCLNCNRAKKNRYLI